MKKLTAVFLFILLSAGFVLNAQVAAPARAVIPDRQVSLTDFGGVSDGVTSNTEAFRKAIAALDKQGGGLLSARRAALELSPALPSYVFVQLIFSRSAIAHLPPVHSALTIDLRSISAVKCAISQISSPFSGALAYDWHTFGT